MPVAFRKEEQLLIDELQKNPADRDLAVLSKEFVKSIGNKSFNGKLREFLIELDAKAQTLEEGSSEKEDIKEKSASIISLSKFIYKTLDVQKASDILNRLEVSHKLAEQSIEVAEFEKLTLREIGILDKISSIQDDSMLKGMIEAFDNPEFQLIIDTIKKSTEELKNLEEKTLKESKFKAGDLMMYLTEKTTALKERQNLSGHEGKLEQQFLTKYNHAAPVYMRKGLPTKSDVWVDQRTDSVQMREVLESDSFHIDPIKLVDSKIQKKLEQVDYGKNKDGTKITWQEVMRERYEQLSQALHDGLITTRIEVLKEKISASSDKLTELKEAKGKDSNTLRMIKNDQVFIADIEKKLLNPSLEALDKPQLEKKLQTARNRLEIFTTKNPDLEAISQRITTRNQEIKKLNDSIDHEQKELKKLSEQKLIQNDQVRLGSPSKWLGGHSNLFSKTDFRDLSQKMFDATPEQKQMICSEWAARSIASTVDQLSRITSFDLQAAGLVPENKEAKVLTSPIPKKEIMTKIHPERLVDLLQKAGCIERVHNKALEQVIDTENTRKTRSAPISELLPRKMLALLKKSKTEEDFVDKANKTMEAYLKVSKVDFEPTEAIKTELSELYKQHTKQPQGIIENVKYTVNKVLEFCKIRNKNSHSKEKIDNIIKGVNKGVEDIKQEQLKALAASVSVDVKGPGPTSATEIKGPALKPPTPHIKS